MKKQDLEQLKNKSSAELEKGIIDNKEKLRVLKFDLSAGKVKNVKEIQVIKKMIARMYTLIKHK